MQYKCKSQEEGRLGWPFELIKIIKAYIFKGS